MKKCLKILGGIAIVGAIFYLVCNIVPERIDVDEDCDFFGEDDDFDE